MTSRSGQAAAMDFRSTRGSEQTDILAAIMRGLAADGGLYVPESLPRLSAADIGGTTLAEIASELLQPFFAGSALEHELAAICADALNFPVPLRRIEQAEHALRVLELFHGPTAAFKDVGARFLAATMERVLAADESETRPLMILVATSGDTGGAVAAAFHGRERVRVGVLFPKGQVSPRQRHQLTCWGGNVRSFEIDGTFDDCQAIVKAAFRSASLRERQRLSAANSINLGRLLPQVAYHAAAAIWHWRETGEPLSCIVPTGNLGNGLACVWARAIGMPIADIILAVNANQTIPDFLATGVYQPRDSRRTLASAMDVGDPSNMERLRDLIPDFGELRGSVQAYPVDDEAIREQIGRDYRRYGEIWCPHTATGFWVYDHLSEAQRAGASWSVCATAHPAKFETIVEPIIGRPVEVPPALAEILQRPSESIELPPRLDALAEALDEWK